MQSATNPTNPSFPHHRLQAWATAADLAVACQRIAARIPRGQRSLADQLARASQSTALLIAEGANRMGMGEKRQRYSLARGECGECAAALELAQRLGLAPALEVAAALALADRVGAMLTRLVVRFGG